jgi:hypothetical protein
MLLSPPLRAGRLTIRVSPRPRGWGRVSAIISIKCTVTEIRQHVNANVHRFSACAENDDFLGGACPIQTTPRLSWSAAADHPWSPWPMSIDPPLLRRMTVLWVGLGTARHYPQQLSWSAAADHPWSPWPMSIDPRACAEDDGEKEAGVFGLYQDVSRDSL